MGRPIAQKNHNELLYLHIYGYYILLSTFSHFFQNFTLKNRLFSLWESAFLRKIKFFFLSFSKFSALSCEHKISPIEIANMKLFIFKKEKKSPSWALKLRRDRFQRGYTGESRFCHYQKTEKRWKDFESQLLRNGTS